jgi:hypothetical protein
MPFQHLAQSIQMAEVEPEMALKSLVMAAVVDRSLSVVAAKTVELAGSEAVEQAASVEGEE